MAKSKSVLNDRAVTYTHKTQGVGARYLLGVRMSRRKSCMQSLRSTSDLNVFLAHAAGVREKSSTNDFNKKRRSTSKTSGLAYEVRGRAFL